MPGQPQLSSMEPWFLKLYLLLVEETVLSLPPILVPFYFLCKWSSEAFLPTELEISWAESIHSAFSLFTGAIWIISISLGLCVEDLAPSLTLLPSHPASLPCSLPPSLPFPLSSHLSYFLYILYLYIFLFLRMMWDLCFIILICFEPEILKPLEVLSFVLCILGNKSRNNGAIDLNTQSCILPCAANIYSVIKTGFIMTSDSFRIIQQSFKAPLHQSQRTHTSDLKLPSGAHLGWFPKIPK